MMNVVLLTATIRPKEGQPDLRVIDPDERLGEYTRALAFYHSLLARGRIDRLVFADNSGFDLGPLAARFGSDGIEWMSCFDLDYPSHYHRGYGELRLIDWAWANSATLRTLGERDMVWKVTGRYIVSNLVAFLRVLPPRVDLYANLDGDWMGMEIFGVSRRGFDTLLRGSSAHYEVGIPPELTLARRLRAGGFGECRIETRFHWPVDIVGRRGSDGSRFRGRWSPLRHALRIVESVLLLPLRRWRFLKASYE
jgi:hypothetical protein